MDYVGITLNFSMGEHSSVSGSSGHVGEKLIKCGVKILAVVMGQVLD